MPCRHSLKVSPAQDLQKQRNRKNLQTLLTKPWHRINQVSKRRRRSRVIHVRSLPLQRSAAPSDPTTHEECAPAPSIHPSIEIHTHAITTTLVSPHYDAKSKKTKPCSRKNDAMIGPHKCSPSIYKKNAIPPLIQALSCFTCQFTEG